MKKLMVLAAVAAMALGAKADWSVSVDVSWLSFRARPGHFEGVIPNYMDYCNYYVLLTSDFNNWQETSGTLEGLNAASWVTAKGVDWFGESMAEWSSGFAALGEFTKVPTKDGNLLLPWDPTESADLTLVAASDKAYYAEDYVYDGDIMRDEEQFNLEITLVSSEGPIAFSGSTPAPEPTSGLLLLLGVAGLALRRRRA